MRHLIVLVSLCAGLTGCSLVSEELEVRSRQADGSEVVQVIRHAGGVESLHGADYTMTRQQGATVTRERCESSPGTHTLYCVKE